MTGKGGTTLVEVPGYGGGALRVPAGALLRVTDLEGEQIGDLFLLAASDPGECFSPALTRLVVFGRAFPLPGQPFVSNRRRVLATLERDTSPGVHDMSYAPCDAQFYRDLGIAAPHPNCRDNFLAAAAAIGLAGTPVPDPINVFQNSPTYPDGTIGVGPALSRAGDFIELRAAVDLVAVLTACSVDVALEGVLPNGPRSTPMRLEVR